MRAAFLACSRAPALPHRERVYQRPPPCRACRPSGMAWMEVGGGPAMALGVLTVKQPGVNDSWESKTRIRPSPQPPSTRRMQRCSLASRPKAPCPVLRHSVRTRSASSRKLRLPLALTRCVCCARGCPCSACTRTRGTGCGPCRTGTQPRTGCTRAGADRSTGPRAWRSRTRSGPGRRRCACSAAPQPTQRKAHGRPAAGRERTGERARGTASGRRQRGRQQRRPSLAGRHDAGGGRGPARELPAAVRNARRAARPALEGERACSRTGSGRACPCACAGMAADLLRAPGAGGDRSGSHVAAVADERGRPAEVQHGRRLRHVAASRPGVEPEGSRRTLRRGRAAHRVAHGASRPVRPRRRPRPLLRLPEPIPLPRSPLRPRLHRPASATSVAADPAALPPSISSK
jgi:hypothetical protein